MADLLQSLIIPQRSEQNNSSPSLASSFLTSSSPLSPPSLPNLILPPKQDSAFPEGDMNNRTATPPHPTNEQFEATAEPDDLNTQSIEDFERLYAQLLAETKTNEAQRVSSSKSGLNCLGSSTSPTPVALGNRSSESVVAFNAKIQGLRLPYPVFDYEGDTLSGFSVRCTFLDEVVEDKGQYTSKREAKERVCAAALDLLNKLEREGKIPNAGKKAAVAAENGDGSSKQEGNVPEENWTGMLLEYHNAMGLSQPTFAEYQVGSSYFCLLTIPQRLDVPFGSQDRLIVGKKLARQNSAKEAVEWLRSEGHLEYTDGPIKKRKRNPAPVSNSSVPVSSSGRSFASQVAELAIALGLGTLEYRAEDRDPRASGFVTLECYFKDGGKHRGPHGRVRNVMGKKAAKEECARQTLGYLENLKREREEWGRKVLGETNEKENVIDVPV